MMNKFKQLLFLKSIKRVGKVKIHDNYLSILNEYDDLDDLIMIMESKFGFKLNVLEDAKDNSDKLYDLIINDENIDVITIFDENYPKKLKIMGNKAPLILYAKGNVDVLSKPNIAVIGTRKPSDFSQEFEKDLVKSVLDGTNRVIVSGLALGCDKIAHKVTVDENKPTIAILPSGVNIITPVSNKKLAENIIETGGCLVSEYEPNSKAFKSTYVERDQIVAALSDAVFVVECGVKSGTMHTVNFSNDYQKQIYAYLPTQRPEDSYDGNEFIVNEIENSIPIEDIGEFIEDLKTITVKKQTKTVQQTLI